MVEFVWIYFISNPHKAVHLLISPPKTAFLSKLSGRVAQNTILLASFSHSACHIFLVTRRNSHSTCRFCIPLWISHSVQEVSIPFNYYRLFYFFFIRVNSICKELNYNFISKLSSYLRMNTLSEKY